jgi:hypothetical protein
MLHDFRLYPLLRLTRLAFSCLLVASCGCGESGDKRMAVYPVTGSVAVKGQPAEGAQVVFFRADESLHGTGHPLPTGVVGPDGKFMLSSYAVNDGAPAGEYEITVVWPDVVKSTDSETEPPLARDRLKDRYAVPSQSGLKATVQDRPTELEPFNLP